MTKQLFKELDDVIAKLIPLERVGVDLNTEYLSRKFLEGQILYKIADYKSLAAEKFKKLAEEQYLIQKEPLPESVIASITGINTDVIRGMNMSMKNCISCDWTVREIKKHMPVFNKLRQKLIIQLKMDGKNRFVPFIQWVETAKQFNYCFEEIKKEYAPSTNITDAGES